MTEEPEVFGAAGMDVCGFFSCGFTKDKVRNGAGGLIFVMFLYKL